MALMSVGEDRELTVRATAIVRTFKSRWRRDPRARPE